MSAPPDAPAPRPGPLPPGLGLLRRLPLPRRLGLLERLYGRALAARGAAWITTSTGVPWKLDLTDVTQRWVVYGDYEGRDQMQWCRQWLAAGGVVVDSGASLGQMLLYLAPLDGVRVHAFEPVPACAGWLRECLAAQPAWEVRVAQCALSDETGTLTLQESGPHSTVRLDWYPDRGHPRREVPAIRLDDYASGHGIRRIRLWKLDVEGAEEQALRGARDLLRRQAVDAVLVEVSPDSWEGLRRLLGAHGYEPARITRGGRIAADARPPHRLVNRVFLPPPGSGPGSGRTPAVDSPA